MLENIMKVSNSRLIDMIVESCLVAYNEAYNGLAGIIYGAMGIGKSTAPITACERLTSLTSDVWQVIDIRVLLYDPVELKGIGTIILLDETTKAFPSVLSALMQFVLDRRVGDFRFGRNWVPMLTGNRLSDKSGDMEIPAALRDRAWQVELVPSVSEWLDWAVENNIHPLVESFIRTGPDYLFTWDPDNNPMAFATGRSWYMVSQMCHVSDNPETWGFAYMGQEIGQRFASHCELVTKMPDPLIVLRDPANAPVMDSIGMGFYLASALAYHTTTSTMGALCAYARRCAHEVATAMVNDAVSRHPELKDTAEYITFVCEFDPRQS
jgi:hypothetical protein